MNHKKQSRHLYLYIAHHQAWFDTNNYKSCQKSRKFADDKQIQVATKCYINESFVIRTTTTTHGV